MKYFSYIFLFMILMMNRVQSQNNLLLSDDFWSAQPDLNQVKQAVANGNNPSAQNNRGFDATTYAILNNADVSIIDFLLQQDGNSVDKKTHDGRIYLLWAGSKGNIPLIEYLIEKGSDVMAVEDKGNNLVTYTAVRGVTNPAVYTTFKQHGVPLSIQNTKGAHALLLLAPAVKQVADLNFLLKEKDIQLTDTDKDGNNIFLYTATSGNIPMLKDLIQHKINPLHENLQKENAMFFAAQGQKRSFNNIEVFEFLKSIGVPTRVSNKNNETPLHKLASRNNHISIYEFFINQGVDANQKDKNGNPAIFYAVQGNNNSVAKFLLNDFQNINETNAYGETLMTKAIAGGNADIFDALIQKNMDLKHLNQKGESYLYPLFQSYNPQNQKFFEKAFNVFKNAGISASSAQLSLFHIAVEKNSLFLLHKAQEISQDINQKNEKGFSPLQLAAMQVDDVQFMKDLIAFGADKNVRTDFDESVLDLASENEKLQGQDLTFLN